MARRCSGDAALIGDITDLFLLHRAGGLSGPEFTAAKLAVGVGGGVHAERAGAVRKGSGGGLRLYLRSADASAPHAIDVAPDATARDVAAAARGAGLPDAVVSFQGRTLAPGDLLADAGVGAESVLDVVAAPPRWKDHAPALRIGGDGSTATLPTGTSVGMQTVLSEAPLREMHGGRCTITLHGGDGAKPAGGGSARELSMVYVGAALPGVPLADFIGNSHGKGWEYAFNGEMYHRGSRSTYEGQNKALYDGDQITVCFDAMQGTLRFLVNGVEQPKGFDNVGANAHAAVTFHDPHTAVIRAEQD